MFMKFRKDTRGNYALVTALAMAPLMGALAIAVDYTEMSRQRLDTRNALDAANIATARQLQSGATETQAKAYAQDFFLANLRHVKPGKTTLNVTLPSNAVGGGEMKMCADLVYSPYFLPAAAKLIGKTSSDFSFTTCSQVRLKNSLEVALVLDNSGSMDDKVASSTKSRIELLKAAAKQLVDTISKQADMMKQVEKPVQFAVVPFAASVNVGTQFETSAWMDTTGASPIHHENLDWSVMTQTRDANQYAQKVGDIWMARGSTWDAAQKDKPLTRFSLFKLLKKQTGSHKENGKTIIDYGSVASWGGCVEARPAPYNINDTLPTTSKPESYFVPMFAPDETGNIWTKQSNNSIKTFGMNNSWWDDNGDTSTSTTASVQVARQKNTLKYIMPGPLSLAALPTPINGGPNYMCTTSAITPLQDVTKTDGKTKINTAIDGMAALGATNVPEGMAWGWRVLSHGEPFSEGRSEIEKGNDKVVIVLTDGANTYYTPGYFGDNDYAGNKSSYSAYGYTGTKYQNGDTRLFMGTSSSVVKSGNSAYTESNYSTALNEQFAKLCDNAKANNLIVMTVALDLDSKKSAESAQIAALKKCASDSRYRKDPTDPSKPDKMFWNATSSTLENDFKKIADELSNLRIVG
ncbi:hypothetical protein ASD50_08695 [Mesorhizobium sp. Root552]|nr:hypothetical protein ASD50_08695 [Mesorhizobium sp. Root552]